MGQGVGPGMKSSYSWSPSKQMPRLQRGGVSSASGFRQPGPSPSPVTFTCPHLLMGTSVCVTLQDGNTHFALPRVRSSWSFPIFCCRR